MEILLLLALALLCLIGIVLCNVMRAMSVQTESYARCLVDESQKAQKQFDDALAVIKKPCQGVRVDQLPEEVQIAVLSQATMESDEFERFMRRLHSTEDPK
jgi:hypothetical protein